MFKESLIRSLLEPSCHTESHLPSKLRVGLSDKKAWFNIFHHQIISRINESIYYVLYSKTQGRPNASIRVLIGMRILKEGQGLTDRQLFESCGYHLLYRQALGLVNLGDSLPSPATYYNFFNACIDYEEQTGIDLLALTFASVTKDQVFDLKVDGQSIRMDSKLVQSNIAFMSRLQLFLDVLIKFYKSLSSVEKGFLPDQTNTLLSDLVKKKSSTHIFGLTKEAGKDLFSQLGSIGLQLCELNTDQTTEAYQLLSRFMSEHFVIKQANTDESIPTASTDEESSLASNKEEDKIVAFVTKQENTDGSIPTASTDEESSLASNKEEDKIVALPKPTNGGSSLQSIHDKDAGFRTKEGSKKQVVKGYVINVTETCQPDEKLKLVTDVCTKIATASDDTFFQESIERTEKITQQIVKDGYTDGAYHSPANQHWVKNREDKFRWYLTAISGKEGIYDFEKRGDTYLVTDRITGEKQLAKKTDTGKYRINIKGKFTYRYFQQLTIDNYFLRQKIKKISKEAKGIRANCEASINQMFCKLNGNKTRYRGLVKHQRYAICRAFWVNLTRIKEFFLVFLIFRRFFHLSDLMMKHTSINVKKIKYTMSMNDFVKNTF